MSSCFKCFECVCCLVSFNLLQSSFHSFLICDNCQVLQIKNISQNIFYINLTVVNTAFVSISQHMFDL